MSRLMGIALTGGELREVPKYGLNFEEVCFALGCSQLAKELREIGALVPRRCGRVLLFDAGEVAEAWARFHAGQYEGKLRTKGPIFPD
jgi:hypothetical protein